VAGLSLAIPRPDKGSPAKIVGRLPNHEAFRGYRCFASLPACVWASRVGCVRFSQFAAEGSAIGARSRSDRLFKVAAERLW
jgi:hypothetical protein